MNKYQQGEPLNIVFECLHDNNETPYDMRGVKVSATILQGCELKYKYSTETEGETRIINYIGNSFLKLNLSSEDTKKMEGVYTLELKVHIVGGPAIDSLKNSFTIEKSTIGKINSL